MGLMKENACFIILSYVSSVVSSNLFANLFFLSFGNLIFKKKIYRHHIYEQQGGVKSIELKEIGPRFELRLYQVPIL